MPTEADTGGVTYLEAIGAAMMSEMEADPDVFLIGEDVGQFGGAFKVTKGFLEKFGPRRVVDTPIAETGIHRSGSRRGARRAAPDRRVPVRRLHLVRVRPHHQRDGAAPLPHRRRDAGDDASAVRCATAGRPHALAERRVLLRARPRIEDRHARLPAGRGGSADQRDQGQQPGPLPGEQVSVPPAAQRRTDQSRPHSAGSGQRGSRGQRRHTDHVLGRCVAGRRDRRRIGQGRHLGRGHRHPDAGAAGHRHDRHVGQEDRKGGRAARSRAPARVRRGDRGRGAGEVLLASGLAGGANRGEEHPDPDQPCRWRTR